LLNLSSNAYTALYIDSAVATNPEPNVRFRAYRGTIASPTTVADTDAIGSLIVNAYDGTTSLRVANISAVVDGTVGTNDLPTRWDFSTTNDGASSATVKMVIKNNGNVGIGTTGPGAKLHIYEAANQDVTLNIQSTGSGASTELRMTSLNTRDASIFFNDGEDVGRINYGHVTNMMQFFTNGISTADMVIDSNGNVGIGTTSPLTIFSVKGGIASISFNSQDGTVLQLMDSDATCTFNPESGGLTPSCSSDARLKTDITSAPDQLDYLTGLPIRQFKVIASGETKIGTIAQELLALPAYADLVSSGSDSYFKVAEISSWKLLKGIQELDMKIASMSAEMKVQSQISGGSGTINISAILSGILGLLKDSYHLVIEDGVLKAVKFIADTIEAREIKASEKICIDDVCVSKQQLKELLDQNQLQNVLTSDVPGTSDVGSSPTASPSESPTPSDSPEPTETLLPSLEPTPSPSETPEPSQEPTALSTPEPSPEATPEILLESTPEPTPENEPVSE